MIYTLSDPRQPLKKKVWRGGGGWWWGSGWEEETEPIGTIGDTAFSLEDLGISTKPLNCAGVILWALVHPWSQGQFRGPQQLLLPCDPT